MRTGAALRLEKRIPMAAGLGGGSSDAAATIVALNRLWNLQLSLTEQRRLAARLGSDVPFILTGGTALATGRGERITPLPPLPQHWVVLVLLPCALSTAAVYQAVTPADYTAGVATADVVAAAHRGALSPQAGWHNALARPARALAPEITAAQNGVDSRLAPHTPTFPAAAQRSLPCAETKDTAHTLVDPPPGAGPHHRDRPIRSIRLGLGRSGRIEPGASGANGYAWWYGCCMDKDSPARVFRLPH